MDGFEDNTGVVIMAATNRPAALDQALTRPGRFDRIVHLPLPNVDVSAAVRACQPKQQCLESYCRSRYMGVQLQCLSLPLLVPWVTNMQSRITAASITGCVTRAMMVPLFMVSCVSLKPKSYQQGYVVLRFAGAGGHS